MILQDYSLLHLGKVFFKYLTCLRIMWKAALLHIHLRIPFPFNQFYLKTKKNKANHITY